MRRCIPAGYAGTALCGPRSVEQVGTGRTMLDFTSPFNSVPKLDCPCNPPSRWLFLPLEVALAGEAQGRGEGEVWKVEGGAFLPRNYAGR